MTPWILLCLILLIEINFPLSLGFQANGRNPIRQPFSLKGYHRTLKEIGMSKRQMFRSIRDRVNRLSISPEYLAVDAPDVILHVGSTKDGRQQGDCPFTRFLQMYMTYKGIKFGLKYVVPIDLPSDLRDKHHGALPIAEFEGKTMDGVLKIAEYLESKYPNLPLFKNLTFTYQEVLERTKDFYPTLVKYISNRDKALEPTYEYEFNKQLDIVDQTCRSSPGKFICGMEITLADIYLLPIIFSADIATTHFKQSIFVNIDCDHRRPGLEKWMIHMMKQPVFKDPKVFIPVDTIVWGWRKLRGEVANPYTVRRNVKT